MGNARYGADFGTKWSEADKKVLQGLIRINLAEDDPPPDPSKSRQSRDGRLILKYRSHRVYIQL